MDGHFRLGVIGHGKWPSLYLIPGAQQLPDVDVVAVCGRDPERAAAAAAAHGIPRSYVSVAEMMRAEDLDGVIIATPPEHHEAAARAVAGFRAAVLCEKPLALDGAGAGRIRDWLVGQPALTGFTLRWQPLFRAFQDAVSSGTVGAPKHLRMHYVQSSAATPARPWDWHFDVDSEPLGVVSDLGPHAIDLLRWIIGDVDRVMAFGRTTIAERVDPASGELRAVTNADDADLLIETTGGPSASLTISRVAPDSGMPGSVSIDVLAERGWIRLDAGSAEIIIGTSGGIKRRPIEVVPFLDGATAQIRDFVDLARGSGRAGLPSIDDGYRAQRVMDAIARSLETGQFARVEGRG